MAAPTTHRVHSAREEDKITHKSTWKRANPSLAIDAGLGECHHASEAKLATHGWFDASGFQSTPRLNMGVEDTEQATLLDAGTWQNIESEDVDMSGSLPVWGVDLGGSAASSAVAAFWPDSGRLETLAAFPNESLTCIRTWD